MEAEKERSKDPSAHTVLDGKVLCGQDGRLGETMLFHLLLCALGFLQGDLCVCRYSENAPQPAENHEHAADSHHRPLTMCW